MASAAECPPLYPYHPNLVLACVGIGLFTVLAGIHMTRMFMTRTWDNIFFVLGGFCTSLKPDSWFVLLLTFMQVKPQDVSRERTLAKMLAVNRHLQLRLCYFLWDQLY